MSETRPSALIAAFSPLVLRCLGAAENVIDLICLRRGFDSNLIHDRKSVCLAARVNFTVFRTKLIRMKLMSRYFWQFS